MYCLATIEIEVISRGGPFSIVCTQEAQISSFTVYVSFKSTILLQNIICACSWERFKENTFF